MILCIHIQSILISTILFIVSLLLNYFNSKHLMRNSLFETSLNSISFSYPQQLKKGWESLKSSRNQKQMLRGVYGNSSTLGSGSKHSFVRKKHSDFGIENKNSSKQCSSWFIKKPLNISNMTPIHQSVKDHNLSQYFSNKVHRKEDENKDASYTKIVAKLQAKDKIMKQLKKLSETNISIKFKQPYQSNKGLSDCSNQLNTGKIMTPKVSKTPLKELGIYISPKYQEKNQFQSLKNTYNKQKNVGENQIEHHLSHTYLSQKNQKPRHKRTTSDVLNLSSTSISHFNHHSSIKYPKTPTKVSGNDMPIVYPVQPPSNKTKFTLRDFVIGKSLGEGKFGTVFQAIHKKTGFLVVLKKINKFAIKSNLMIEQFVLEVKLQSFCDHENIVKLYGFFEDRGSVYLILQYMEEGTLFKMLKKSKTMRERCASSKLREVAQAIKYLHDKGIVHRDIKPQNVVISHGTAKICDFGWAAICNERRKTHCGTFDYTAPQILEGVEYGLTVDLWCLGILAYELLVGKAPFYHHSRKQTIKKIISVEPLSFPGNLTKKAVSFMQNLIRKKPEERMRVEDVLKHPFLATLQPQ